MFLWCLIINSVLRCRNNECGIVIDRDINGCKNIFKIFKCALEGKDRPKILPKKKTRSTVKVGITVNKLTTNKVEQL